MSKIKEITCCFGRKKTILSEPNIKYLEVKLKNGKYFDIEIDDDGDVVIKGSGNVFVSSNEENELIFTLKK